MHFRLIEQLKQRNVFRVAALYLVVCWLILEPIHVVFHMLDVPIWANRLVVMLMAVGFPAVVIFAWVYEITPEGLKPTVEVPHGESIRRLTGRRLDRAIIAVLAVALAYFVVDKFWISKHLSSAQTTAALAQSTASPTSSTSAAATAFSPPPHSIAVLPFVNMSGDKEQEYFSEGLTEELLNSLSRINELQVAARTSSFSFQGEHPDIATVAHKLNVGAVLEGSVRRSAHTVRVTAQLINAVSGFHLWSESYDRDLGDVLKLQTDIATAVAGAMKVTLLGDIAEKIELGGTRNPAAFDAYLRGIKGYSTFNSTKELQAAVAAFTDAIRLDPNYAIAVARRSIALGVYAAGYTKGPDIREKLTAAHADALRAIALAPDLAESHVAMAYSLEARSLDFAHAAKEYERARALSPGNALALAGYGRFAVLTGQTESGIAAMRSAVVLDPLDPFTRSEFGQVLYWAHQYDKSISTYQDELVLDSGDPDAYAYRGLAYYALGNFEEARLSCEFKPDDAQTCLAIIYDKLGRRADAQAVLEKLKASEGDGAALSYAEIYAQWGNPANALQWLEVALRMRDPWLVGLKADPLLDPLRKEPRFQAIERALKFPD